VIELFFDCSSPSTWLGFESVQPLAAKDRMPLVRAAVEHLL
jgi:2-hydroxychromene-2-carboxylate isomerase